MYIFYFLIFGLFFNNTALADGGQDAARNVVIACNDDELCQNELPGSKCTKNVCVCPLDGDGCQERVASVAVRRIGKSCKSNRDCLIDNSICEESDGKCRCLKYAIASEDERSCLPLLSELNLPCLEDAQCSKIAHSECRMGVCRCKKSMKTLMGLCYLNKDLGDKCRENDDCIAIENSECYADKCVCKKKFVPANSTCLRAADNLGESCLKDVQCSWNLGYGAICRRNKCACMGTYRFKADLKRCVQHLTLFQVCQMDGDCHQTPEDVAYIKCSANLCRCKAPYKEFEDDCVNASASAIRLFPWTILSLLLLSPRLMF